MAPVTRPLAVRVDNKVFPAVGDRAENHVLKNISFKVEPGSFVVITGPSGGGKSTLLNIISGLDKDFEGTIEFGGDHDPRIAFVFQTPRLLPWRTVYENIALALPKGDPRIAKIPELLKRVGLTEAANAYPEMISLGMQRRVALARAFVLEPELLLMDEPFVSLDDPTAYALRELLVELWSARPTTVLFVTHDRPEAVMLGTRILRLSNGAATIAQDVPVRLSVADRADREKVRTEQRRIFGEA
ncbi:MAG TPA: ABC transporter ATP-binding protein [Hyphomicrobium sp.]|jgi:NitT/TauT family transport system ATP-binding protein